MASLSFIQKRIEGKQKEIEKLEKKLARINEAAATGWEKNPYYYSESDIRYTEKDILAAKHQLEQYQAQLREEQDKAASRNVPVITEFLNQWEQRSIEYFLEQKKAYDEVYPKYHEELKSIQNKRFDYSSTTPEERKELRKKETELSRKFNEDWAHVKQFFASSLSWEAAMRKALAAEKIAKYDDFLNRIIAITGTIEDASGLYIGLKGDINGFVSGNKGSAEVQTIGAGGYAVQRYHFRTLVKPYRKEA